MTNIDYITLEVDDTAAAEKFYAAAFDLDSKLRFTTSDAPTSGFRGFHVSLVVSQPATVQSLFDSAVAAGATVLKPVAKSMWGHGGVVQAPDGAIWKLVTSAKKDTGPDTRENDQVVLLVGAEDVGATKKFYIDHGLKVRKSIGGYVDFDMPTSPVKFGLYTRRALAKDAGVDVGGTGSHRILIGSSAGPFTDPDGFEWVA